MKKRACTIANIRMSPGYKDKDGWDVIGSLAVNQVVDTLGTSAKSDDLIWWEIESPIRGWVAESDPDGNPILTTIIEIISPVPLQYPVTQEFGEHPEFYSTIPGYPVPLKGHNGRDYGTPIGTPVFAVDRGHILKAEFDNSGFGNMIRIQHDWGETLYAHLDQMYVSVGQIVPVEFIIGLTGTSGMGSGPHLHFGVRSYPADRADGWGGYSDPRLFLKA